MRKKTKLGDTIEFQRGYDLTHSQMIEGEYPVIGSNGIIGTHNTFKTSDSIVLGRSGTIGNPQIIKGKFWPHNTTLYSTDLKGNNLEYMYYLLKTLHIENYKSGSTVPTLNRNDLSPLEITIEVDTNKQKRISEILSLLDETISTNNKIISELESMEKDIYDYWFVQFDFPDENGKPYKSSGGKMVWNEELKRDIPEGWKADRLGCLISKISTGLNPRDNFKFVDKGIDYYTVKNLCVDGHLDNSGCDHIDRSAQSIIHERSNISIGDILYASIAPLGRTYLITDAPENWEINESIFSIRPNTDKTTSVFLQMYLKSEYLIKLFEQCSVGSIFKGVRIDMLQNSLVLIPSFSIVKKFTNQIKDIVLMQHNKWKENAELTSLRDFLLPLLMNGQVKIGDVSD